MAQTLPSAQPAYILRGHSSPIHSVQFIRSNSRLVTGDADGWIVVWSLATKRPVAVWRAHEGSILGVSAWGSRRLITHGKDNKLIVWKLSEEDESSMSKILPVDTAPEPQKQPWILHILHVNTMNFCSFSQSVASRSSASEEVSKELLIAVPNTMSSETVDLFHLPSCKRTHTIPANHTFKGGMIMALSVFHHPSAPSNPLTVLAGFESGHTSVNQLSNLIWSTFYISNPHSQPILSLAPSPDKSFYLTSSADAMIAKHPIPIERENTSIAVESMPLKTLQTKHAGQQGLRIRNDGLVFATAGWDGRVRVYSSKSVKEMAVLKWHKEACYAVDFADVDVNVSSGEARGSEPGEEGAEEGKGKGKEKEVVKRIGTLTVKEERFRKAKTAHWVAAGSKDGKVSLWDIY